MMGSILTDTGMLFFTNTFIASSLFEISSSSVVMLNATMDGTFFSMSMSLVTREDFVII